MKLSRFAREYYELQISTVTNDGTPVAPNAWEASFNGGANWVAAQVINHVDTGDWSAWLLAGPDAAVGTAVAVIRATEFRPMVRLIDNPEIVVRDAPTILVY